MAPQQVQWGMLTLHLDNEAFCKGFLDARRGYFADLCGERGRPPEEPQHAVPLESSDVLRLIAVPDEQGRYHLGADGGEDVAECLGYLLGYLGGPLAPQEAERYRKEHAQQEYLRRMVTA